MTLEELKQKEEELISKLIANLLAQNIELEAINSFGSPRIDNLSLLKGIMLKEYRNIFLKSINQLNQ